MDAVVDAIKAQLVQLRTKLDDVPILQRLEDQYHVPKEYISVAGSLTLLVVIFLGLSANTLCSIVGFVYPAFKSFQAIEHRVTGDVTQWLIYWASYTTLQTLIMKSAILAATIASAAAFAPAPVAKTTSAINAFEGELGAQPPLGFFDPLGLLDDADQDRFDRLRYVEVKHGRIAQLAFLGQVVTRAGIHLGGNIFMDGTQFSDIGDGYAGFASLGSKSIAQIVLFVGILELGVMKDSANGAAPGDFPGDFRNGALDFGWDTFDEETKLSKRAIELNNGRAAMMGILGLMVHEQLGTDLPIIGQL